MAQARLDALADQLDIQPEAGRVEEQEARVSRTAVSEYGDMHALMFGCLAVVTCFAGGYFSSLITPTKPKNLEGLTIHTPRVAGSSRDNSATFGRAAESNVIA